MTSKVTIVNRALQVLGTRTTVTDSELASETSNEAIQANLVYDSVRRRLLRMAPWNCGMKTAPLVYITSIPGTIDNTSPATATWEPGQPAPPWAYEYQYPVDCLRAVRLRPVQRADTSLLTSISLTGPAAKFIVQTDEFRPVTAATISAAGAGYSVGDKVTLTEGPTGSKPIGAPVVLLVTAVNGSGGITAVSVVTQVVNLVQGGSYFLPQINPVAQGSTDGNGSGAAFNLTFAAAAKQRVILCNHEDALLSYIYDVTEPNVFDEDFIEAYVNVLAASLANALTGDRTIANDAIKIANMHIEQARVSDANESFMVHDPTPDWIAARGYVSGGSTEAYGFDWGPLWPMMAS